MMQKTLTKQQIRRANKALRAKDQSHLWPISGAFNATDRAIRQAMRYDFHVTCNSVYEYESVIHELISRIVNDPKNF